MYGPLNNLFELMSGFSVRQHIINEMFSGFRQRVRVTRK